MKKTLLFLLTLFSCLSIKAQCWKTIAAGYSHTAAVKTDGTLWTWGSNDQGQLGNSIVATENIPTKMGTANDWKTVAAGWGHTVALKKDGSLWAWGYGGLGQIGNGANTTNFNPPQQIGSENNWQTIVTGHGHTVALKTDGTLWACGNNFSGQLGIGSTFDKNTLTQIGTDTNWQTIAAGQLHTVALKKDGTLWAWGKNTLGAVGDGTTTNRHSPIQIGTATNWKTIAAGSNHTIAIKTDGTLWIWGDNTSGALGDGTTTSKIVPTQIGTATDWKSADGGGSYTIAVKTDGSLWAWGFNTDGELGNGSNVNSLVPVQIGTENNWQMATGGAVHTVAIKTDASVWTWGSNPSGQLGDATATNKNVPTRVDCVGSLMLTTAQTNLSCAGFANGSATINTVSGGTAPYSYLWSNGKTTASITGLDAGNYSCTVTDATSLSFTENFTIAQPTPLTLITNVTNTCNNNNGTINVMTYGGTAPYQYSLDGLYYQTSNLFTNIPAGNHQLYTKDSNGCMLIYTVVITAISTPAPTAPTAQTFTIGAKISDLLPIGSNIKWYTENTGGIVLDASIALQTGTYYVSQTVNGCESTRTAVDVTVISLIPTYVPSDGLIAYYPFTGNANDVSGNGYNGIVTGAVLTTDKTGNPNRAYSFDGASSYIDAAIATIPQNNSPRTISGWFKTNSPNTENYYSTIFNYGSLSTTQRFSLSLYSKGYLNFINGPSYTNGPAAQNDYFDNTWHFVAITYDGTKVSMFIDGNYVTGANITLNTINKTFRIGKRITGDTNNEYFKGSIDDIGIWNRVLTANEISDLYNLNRVTAVISPSSSNLCQGDSVQLTSEISASNNYNYSWTKNGILIPNETSPNYTALSTGNYSLIVKNSSGDLIATSNVANVTVNNPTAPIVSSQYFNAADNKKVSDLNANGTNLKWYADATEGNVLDQAAILQNSKYFVSQTVNGCESLRSEFDVIVTQDPISYTVIPDVNFENKLISLGIDSGLADGKVPTANVSSLTSLNISKSNISNLTGIEDFVSLTKLDCGTNKLSTLNVSNNKLLTDLNCRYNNLTVLDLSANLKLTALDCIYNKITSLDVTKIPNLRSLYCTNNLLTSLDVTNNLDLYWFGCAGNQLTTLDVSKNKLLQFLDCGHNQMSSLDISNNTALIYLNCYFNKLTSLDVSMLKELTSLACSGSQLSKLDVSNNVKLNSLLCENINVSTIDVSKNIALKELSCGNGKLTALDVSKNKALTSLSCFNNQVTDLNIKNGTNTLLTSVDFRQNPDLTCIQVDDVAYSNTNWANIKDAIANYSENCNALYTLVPDPNFEQKLIDLGIDTDGLNGKITAANINSITTLDLSNSNIKDLTGIENFTALNILDCSNNQIVSLDLSKNTNLQILYVTGNPLVYINLQNGNNQNLIVAAVTSKKAGTITGTSFLGITTLGCVKVDNATYSNTNWSKIKEATTIYSETCTLDVEDAEFNKGIVYPNPTAGEINILNISIEKATVYNVLGQLVKTFALDSSNNNNTINLSGLPKGVYYIYLIHKDAATVKKVIVE